MARRKRTTLNSFSKIFVLLMTTYGVKSASSPSCTYNCAPFIPGAVAYWPMTNETKDADISGNENHAMFVGLTYTDGPTGEVEGAVHFNGSSNSFAKATNSPSMNVGKYPGFTFSGYVRYLGNQKATASLIDWSGNNGYGVFIVAASEQIIQLHLYPNKLANQHKAEFPSHKLIKGAWHFIGMSYDKATGRATMFKDGQLEVKQLDQSITAGSDKTSEVGLGIDLTDPAFNYKGDMSCMMLFKYALTAYDFKRVMEFCRTTKSTQTVLTSITVSDIATTNANASWAKSPGIFSGYRITIERKQGELGQETVNPEVIPSSDTNLKSVLTSLVSGATYRVHVWHMQGHIKGRARSSAWFHTTPYLVVDSDSIIFSEVTATSAKVSWNDVTGKYDHGYLVDISPTTGGAKADPSTVPRGTTTTALMSLSPKTNYTIRISAKSGLKKMSPSTRSFQTQEQSFVVESDSIIFSKITAISANVSWKEVSGKFDAYTVDIAPTTGGAKADPSTIERGTTTTSLQNLSPGSSYTITIRTKIGSRTSSPSKKTFQTQGSPKADPFSLPTLVVIGSIMAGFCLVVIAAVVITLVVFFRRMKRLNTRKGGHSRRGSISTVIPIHNNQSADATTNIDGIRRGSLGGRRGSAGFSCKVDPIHEHQQALLNADTHV